jgi:hypothetical protein
MADRVRDQTGRSLSAYSALWKAAQAAEVHPGWINLKQQIFDGAPAGCVANTRIAKGD